MILRYAYLHSYPTVFLKLTGLRVKEFDSLVDELEPVLLDAETQRLTRANRQRAPGGGLRPTLDSRDRLLLTVIWLRQYPTHDVLGYLFGVSQPTVGRYLEHVLPILSQSGRDSMRRSDLGRKRRRSLEMLLVDVPELALVVDSFEQRIQRPKTAADREGWYSGKKRMETLKSQLAVDDRTGRIVHVANSVPGRTADIKLLKESGLLDEVEDGVGVLGDSAYQGLRSLHPLGRSPHKKPHKRELTADEKLYNRAFSQRRIIVENIIRRVRQYQCLTQTDREHRRRHTERVCAVAGLVNRQLALRLAA